MQWTAEVYAWYADYRDKISPRFTGDVTPEGRLVVQSDNLNDVTLYGFEAGLRYFGGNNIEYYAVANYTWGEEYSEGHTVPADRDYHEHGLGIDAAGRNIGIWLDLVF